MERESIDVINTENFLIQTFIQKNVSANEQPYVEKYDIIDIGGTNFCPIEHFDMVQNHFTNILLHRLLYALEILYYLQGLQSDLESKSASLLGTKMKRFIVPEVRKF